VLRQQEAEAGGAAGAAAAAALGAEEMVTDNAEDMAVVNGGTGYRKVVAVTLQLLVTLEVVEGGREGGGAVWKLRDTVGLPALDTTVKSAAKALLALVQVGAAGACWDGGGAAGVVVLRWCWAAGHEGAALQAPRCVCCAACVLLC
jgi:hypothetical protein